MRLIDADALKAYFRRPYSNEEMYTNTDIEHIINNLPTIEERPHGEWIPCLERLPEESLNSVIGWDRFRERCVFVQYMDGHFRVTGKQESFDIIAWMPLPKPYVKGGVEE